MVTSTGEDKGRHGGEYEEGSGSESGSGSGWGAGLESVSVSGSGSWSWSGSGSGSASGSGSGLRATHTWGRSASWRWTWGRAWRRSGSRRCCTPSTTRCRCSGRAGRWAVRRPGGTSAAGGWGSVTQAGRSRQYRVYQYFGVYVMLVLLLYKILTFFFWPISHRLSQQSTVITRCLIFVWEQIELF